MLKKGVKIDRPCFIKVENQLISVQNKTEYQNQSNNKQQKCLVHHNVHSSSKEIHGFRSIVTFKIGVSLSHFHHCTFKRYLL